MHNEKRLTLSFLLAVLLMPHAAMAQTSITLPAFSQTQINDFISLAGTGFIQTVINGYGELGNGGYPPELYDALSSRYRQLFGLLGIPMPDAPISQTVTPRGLDSADTTGGTATYTANNIWAIRSATVDPTRLPLGDQKYVLNAPKKGYMYACDSRYFTFSTVFGSRKIGPWIHGTTWDATQKQYVHGTVMHPLAVFSARTAGGQRYLDGNALPVGVPTGVYPTRTTDPAYEYDQNPSEIVAQTISFSVPADPVMAAAPTCTDLDLGITLDGVELSGPLDSSGRDEVAVDIQDQCGGVAQPGGVYHRHGPSGCIPHISERNALVGYALDGFGIFSPYDASGKELTTNDLDECHGITSPITWNGTTVDMYHYVLTRDFPYSISCFRGTPVKHNFPERPRPPQPDQATTQTDKHPLKNTTCALSVYPAVIAPGQSATLSWTSSNADGVSIDNSVGYVGTAGSKIIWPTKTTTYYCVGYVVDQGYGPNANATVTVTGTQASAPQSIESERNVANALSAIQLALQKILALLGK